MHVVCEELSRLVDHRDLASGAQAGVDSSTEMGPAGGESSRFCRFSRKTWMASVSDRFFSSRRISPWMDELSRRFQQSSMASSSCGVQSPGAQNPRAEQADRAERIELDQEIEDVFGLAAADGEHSVRGNCLHRLAIIVVHLELFLLIDGVGRPCGWR